MTDQPFWQTKRLDQMNDAEWESLCDGCGQCCLNKLQDADTDEIYFTNVACNQLNIKTCQCRNYERRFEYEEDCIKLTRENLTTFNWLPRTCAYRLLGRAKRCRMAPADCRVEEGDACSAYFGAIHRGARE